MGCLFNQSSAGSRNCSLAAQITADCLCQPEFSTSPEGLKSSSQIHARTVLQELWLCLTAGHQPLCRPLLVAITRCVVWMIRNVILSTLNVQIDSVSEWLVFWLSKNVWVASLIIYFSDICHAVGTFYVWYPKLITNQWQHLFSPTIYSM